MPLPVETVLKQIDDVLARHQELRGNSQHDDCSDQPDAEVSALITLMCDMIRRFAPHESQYSHSMKSILEKAGPENSYVIPYIVGILTALRTAYESGYLATITELIHADIFSDFIEMAEYLMSEGYKDAAAVILGSVLEEHLRQLCAKTGIAVEQKGKPKKADLLNSELAGQSVYSKLDQKSITAWLDLRNKAAHGNYGDYSLDQVGVLLQGVRDFMARIPA